MLVLGLYKVHAHMMAVDLMAVMAVKITRNCKVKPVNQIKPFTGYVFCVTCFRNPRRPTVPHVQQR